VEGLERPLTGVSYSSKRLKQGEKVTIYYNPENPKRCKVDDNSAERTIINRNPTKFDDDDE